MATQNECPRCSGARLSVIYYGVDGSPIGGTIECADCGPRHAVELKPTGKAAAPERLIDRKAS
ncbi:MAG: hypothetical protein ACR2GX_01290 [Candidatus Dormibacteria bacterium]